VKPQLFYLIADPDGAAARRAVMAQDKLRDLQFRNAHYDEVKADLARLHGESGRTTPLRLPALWDGHTLHEGLDEVLAAIGRL
jgi:hypothetical protein